MKKIDRTSKIIPYNPKYKFIVLEERLLHSHPVSNYFLKLSDMSVNILCNLKGIWWGYVFLTELSAVLRTPEYGWAGDEIFTFEKTCAKAPFTIPLEAEHLLILDDQPIRSREDLQQLIDEQYSDKLFTKDTLIHGKLKLNLREYLMLDTYICPTFMVLEEEHFI